MWFVEIKNFVFFCIIDIEFYLMKLFCKIVLKISVLCYNCEN